MKCSNCHQMINEDESVVEAIHNRNKKFCHLRCFRCSVCDQSLIGWDFEKDGILYCAQDYYNKFGERCRHCQHFMTGPVMVIGGEYKFHPECFKCGICNAIIGDDESYAYVDQRRLFCNNCLQKQTTTTTTTPTSTCTDNIGLDESVRFLQQKQSSEKNDNVMIQLIELPSCSNGQKRRIKLTLKNCQTGHCCAYYIGDVNSINVINENNVNKLEKNNPETNQSSDDMMIVTEIDINYDPHLLHIGDRILEINGQSMIDKTFEDIKNIFNRNSNESIKLFVEHNPNHDKKGSKSCSPKPVYGSATNGDDVFSPSFNCDHHITVITNNGQPSSPENIGNNFKINTKNDSCAKLNYTGDRPKSQINSTITERQDICNETSKISSSSSSSSAASKSLATRSTSIDKRYRNRERSSSLSRLLESINLNAENNNQKKSENCDNSPSTINNHANPNVQCAQQSYFTSSSSNGFSSKLNNSLSRTRSFRVEPKSYRIFRASDLVKGALLGKGFYGEVFEVTDKVTKEKMVLKELYHNDREAEANFVREVSILKSLNHKNVLHFIGILYRGKKLNLITEYITGGTLRQMIQDETRPIYWPERISWSKDIASGVNYLHSMNLIHRDLNSQNCLVREDGTVVVADFGLSKITCNKNNDDDDGMRKNVATANNSNDESFNDKQVQKLNRRKDRRKRYTIVGHPFWMAPEMMHRDKYDERVDIYSFGIILLEIIGSVNADPDVLKRNRDFSVDKKYFFENYVKKSCPEVFWRIAFLCTELNPDSRPSSQTLERWLQSLAVNHPMQPSSASIWEPTTCNMIATDSGTNPSAEMKKMAAEDLFNEVITYYTSNGLLYDPVIIDR